MLKIIREQCSSLFELIYPRTCAACKGGLPLRRNPFCLDCIYQLKPGSMFETEDNSFSRHFHGRVPIQSGAALFHYSSTGPVRKIIHQLKYKGQKEVGHACGYLLADRIKDSDWQRPDAIVPIPLHPRKQLERGFNQAEEIAKGMSAELKIPVVNLLSRIKYKTSQTKKGRHDRIEGLKNVFTFVKKHRHFAEKNILLVDDVLTTGATLETCANAILNDNPRASLSMCTLAIGRF